MIDINEMTIGEAREVASMIGAAGRSAGAGPSWRHPLLGQRVVVRTYSAGVHIGTLVGVNPENAMECELAGVLFLAIMRLGASVGRRARERKGG